MKDVIIFVCGPLERTARPGGFQSLDSVCFTRALPKTAGLASPTEAQTHATRNPARRPKPRYPTGAELLCSEATRPRFLLPIFVDSKNRRYHGRFGMERGGAEWGGAEQVGTTVGLFAQEITDPLALQGIEDNQGIVDKVSWTTLRKHEQTTPSCKPMEEQSPRFIRRTTAALRFCLLTSGPTPICPCTPWSCKACPGINLSNPKPGDTTGRVGVRRRTATRRGRAGPGRP